MPSRPPETAFYTDPRNYQLWRDISRLYEDNAGPAGEFKGHVKTVLRDVLDKLEEGE
jgi:hypothetical protein